MATKTAQPEEQALALRDGDDRRSVVLESLSVAEVLDRFNKLQTVINKVLIDKVDFGIVPGTSRIINGVETAKPTLFKSGAEKIGVVFCLDAEFQNTRTHDGEHITIDSTCVITHIPSGRRVGSGSGTCSTKESKYAYRMANIRCPVCGKENIRKSNNKSRPGWYCWDKTGGCGTNFAAGTVEIEKQERGQVANDKLPDVWNTVLKMAEKRAHVAAIIRSTGASQFVTQDLEDSSSIDDFITEAEATAQAKAPAPAESKLKIVPDEPVPEAQPGMMKDQRTPFSQRDKPKAAPKTKPKDDGKISDEQVAEVERVCHELDYEISEIVASYAQIKPELKRVEDWDQGVFANFMAKSEVYRKRRLAEVNQERE